MLCLVRGSLRRSHTMTNAATATLRTNRRTAPSSVASNMPREYIDVIESHPAAWMRVMKPTRIHAHSAMHIRVCSVQERWVVRAAYLRILAALVAHRSTARASESTAQLLGILAKKKMAPAMPHSAIDHEHFSSSFWVHAKMAVDTDTAQRRNSKGKSKARVKASTDAAVLGADESGAARAPCWGIVAISGEALIFAACCCALSTDCDWVRGGDAARSSDGGADAGLAASGSAERADEAGELLLSVDRDPL